MHVQVQKGLTRLDGGASAYVYVVSDDIVLKAPVTYYPPAEHGAYVEQYEYAMWTVSLHDDMEDERAIFKQLATRPHANIVQPIALDFEEGIYLQRLKPFAAYARTIVSSPKLRLSWYQDMARAVSHLHSFGIAHADLRIDNFLYNDHDRILLCDFNCARAFGDANPSNLSDLSLNGPVDTVSDGSDMFALASLIYEIETGSRPLHILRDTCLVSPICETGNEDLDAIIVHAWNHHYASTIGMAEDLDRLQRPSSQQQPLNPQRVARMREEVLKWREDRLRNYGAVFDGIYSQTRLRELRDIAERGK